MAIFFGIMVAIGLMALFFFRNMDGLLCRYIYVPEGESWQKTWRGYRDGRQAKKPGWKSWSVMGVGIGLALVAVLVMVLS